MYIIKQQDLYLKNDGFYTPNINEAKIFVNLGDFCNETKMIPITNLVKVGVIISLTKDNTNHYVLINKYGKFFIKEDKFTHLLRDATVFTQSLYRFTEAEEDLIPVNCCFVIYPIEE